MRDFRRYLVATTLLLSVLPAASACSSGGGGGSPASPPPTSGAVNLSQANAMLLTGAEVGAGFTAKADTAPETPLPCQAAGTLPLRQQVPPATYAARLLVDSTGNSAIKESLYSYRDPQRAARLMQLAVDGLSCRTGKLYSTTDPSASAPITISGSQDVTSELSVDGARTWTFAAQGLKGQLVVVRKGGLIITLTFETTTTTAATSLPDADAITKRAVAKVD
jgi:hypothetical protein